MCLNEQLEPSGVFCPSCYLECVDLCPSIFCTYLCHDDLTIQKVIKDFLFCDLKIYFIKMFSLKRIPSIQKHTLCLQFPGGSKVSLNYLGHMNLVALKVME